MDERRVGRDALVKTIIYVEGGGDTKVNRTACRKAFNRFFDKAGLKGRMPRIFASGGREQAYRDFCNDFEKASSSEFIVLLVDSETPVDKDSDAWSHLKARPGDNWGKPAGADADNVHLMVQCMEAWFLADKEALSEFFGQGFNRNALPAHVEIEDIRKEDIYQGLERATRQSVRKKTYHKGRHSFDILAELDPAKVVNASPHAERLVRTLLDKASGS